MSSISPIGVCCGLTSDSTSAIVLHQLLYYSQKPHVFYKLGGRSWLRFRSSFLLENTGLSVKQIQSAITKLVKAHLIVSIPITEKGTPRRLIRLNSTLLHKYWVKTAVFIDTDPQSPMWGQTAHTMTMARNVRLGGLFVTNSQLGKSIAVWSEYYMRFVDALHKAPHGGAGGAVRLDTPHGDRVSIPTTTDQHQYKDLFKSITYVLHEMPVGASVPQQVDAVVTALSVAGVALEPEDVKTVVEPRQYFNASVG